MVYIMPMNVIPENGKVIVPESYRKILLYVIS